MAAAVVAAVVAVGVRKVEEKVEVARREGRG
jgi:hypothetical protein